MTKGLQKDNFGAAGIGLNEVGRARLREAFPDCAFLEGRPEDVEEAQRWCKAGHITTLFVRLPVSDGLARWRTSLLFDQNRVKVVGLCEEATHTLYDEAVLLEFSGAIAVDSAPDIYRRAAAAVHRSELWFSREYLSHLTRRHLGGPARLELSERETAILTLMANDSTNQEIADRLYIARETVRWHLKSLYAKLGVSDRGAARRFARNLRIGCIP